MLKLGQADQAIITSLVALGYSTSAAILAYYGNETALATQQKNDNTPLTAADLVAHEALARGLPAIIDIPFISEESDASSYCQTHQDYWLVDPIDGTRDFIDQTGEFCIAIARIVNHRPVLGFIYAPVSHQYWVALQGKGAYKGKAGERNAPLALQTIHSSQHSDTLRLITARPERSKRLERFINHALGAHQNVYSGSALKFCAIAEGRADLYPKLSSRTCQWDIAAGEIILSEAGGAVRLLGNKIAQYGKGGSLINPPFLAYGAAIDQAKLDFYFQFMQDDPDIANA